MRGSGSFGRALVIVFGVLLVISGLVSVAAGDSAALAGVWLVVVGLVLVVAAIVERFRYRSEVAERAGSPGGPGGGEPEDESLDPHFERTNEVFVDPTSGQRMRVWLDQRTGERRYRSER